MRSTNEIVKIVEKTKMRTPTAISTVLVVESGLRAMGGSGATFGMVEQY